MATKDFSTNVLVPGTEYTVRRALRAVQKLLLWLYIEDHSLICFFTSQHGNMLITDDQIERVNNDTGTITCIYNGRNLIGEHIFLVKDFTQPTQPTQILMEEIQ